MPGSATTQAMLRSSDLIRRGERRLQALRDVLEPMRNAATLRREHAARWTVVLPDAEPGSWRVRLFDERGLVVHSLWGRAGEAVRSVVMAGYRHRDDGALDRVAVLPSFQRGCYLADLAHRVNCGELSIEQYRAQVGTYDQDCRAGVA